MVEISLCELDGDSKMLAIATHSLLLAGSFNPEEQRTFRFRPFGHSLWKEQ